jgi:hypothetical protein
VKIKELACPSLLSTPWAQEPESVLKAAIKKERNGVEIELARLDLGEIEDVVDDQHQGIS